MWWILVPAVAVLISAALALTFRNRIPTLRSDRSVDEPEGDPPVA